MKNISKSQTIFSSLKTAPLQIAAHHGMGVLEKQRNMILNGVDFFTGSLQITAHRGMGVLEKQRNIILNGVDFFPENSIAAFEQAILEGADALECDIHVSKDNVAMVIHGSKLVQYSYYVGDDKKDVQMNLDLGRKSGKQGAKSASDVLQVEKHDCERLQSDFCLKSYRDNFDSMHVEAQYTLSENKDKFKDALEHKKKLLEDMPEFHRIPTLVELLEFVSQHNARRPRDRQLKVNIELKGIGSAAASACAVEKFYATSTYKTHLDLENIVFLGRRSVGEITLMNGLIRGGSKVKEEEKEQEQEQDTNMSKTFREFETDFIENYTLSVSRDQSVIVNQTFSYLRKCLLSLTNPKLHYLLDDKGHLMMLLVKGMSDLLNVKDKSFIFDNIVTGKMLHAISSQSSELLEKITELYVQWIEIFNQNLELQEKSDALGAVFIKISKYYVNQKSNRIDGDSDASCIEKSLKSNLLLKGNKLSNATFKKAALWVIYSVYKTVLLENEAPNIEDFLKFIQERKHHNLILDKLKKLRIVDDDKYMSKILSKSAYVDLSLLLNDNSYEIARKKAAQCDWKKKNKTFTRFNSYLKKCKQSVGIESLEEIEKGRVKATLMLSTGQLFGEKSIVDNGDFDTTKETKKITDKGRDLIFQALATYHYDGIDISLYDYSQGMIDVINEARIERERMNLPPMILAATASNWKASTMEKSPVGPVRTVVRSEAIGSKCDVQLLLKVDEPGFFQRILQQYREIYQSNEKESNIDLLNKRWVQVDLGKGYHLDLSNFYSYRIPNLIPIKIVNGKPPRGREKSMSLAGSAYFKIDSLLLLLSAPSPASDEISSQQENNQDLSALILSAPIEAQMTLTSETNEEDAIHEVNEEVDEITSINSKFISVNAI